MAIRISNIIKKHVKDKMDNNWRFYQFVTGWKAKIERWEKLRFENWRHTFFAAGTIRIGYEEAQIDLVICDFLSSFKSGRSVEAGWAGSGMRGDILRNLSLIVDPSMGTCEIALGRFGQTYRHSSSPLSTSYQYVAEIVTPGQESKEKNRRMCYRLRNAYFHSDWMSYVHNTDLEEIEKHLAKRLPASRTKKPRRYRIAFDRSVIKKCEATHPVNELWYDDRKGETVVTICATPEGIRATRLFIPKAEQ